MQARASSIPARLAEATGLSPAELDGLRSTLDRLRAGLAEVAPQP